MVRMDVGSWVVGLWVACLTVPSVVHGQAPALRLHCSLCRLQYEMAFKNARFEVGELIVVTTRLRNVGTVPITIAVSSRVTGRYDDYHFTVADVNGRPAADPGAGAIEGLNSPVGFVTIEPGRVYTRDMPLNYHMAPLEPGRYVVRGVFAGSFPQVGAESIERTFDIVATSPAQRRTRVAQLAGELERGADPNRVAPLLGFTGDPSARAPLIDLLYASDDGVRASAADALLFLDHEQVVRSLLDAIRTRGPHNRLLDFLSGSPDVVPAEVIGVLSPWLRSTNQESRAAAVKGLRFFISRLPDRSRRAIRARPASRCRVVSACPWPRDRGRASPLGRRSTRTAHDLERCWIDQVGALPGRPAGGPADGGFSSSGVQRLGDWVPRVRCATGGSRVDGSQPPTGHGGLGGGSRSGVFDLLLGSVRASPGGDDLRTRSRARGARRHRRTRSAEEVAVAAALPYGSPGALS
jgi:hypothetical protein